jgi:hypothetical protein
MEHDKSIALYLSGLADEKAEILTENALQYDDELFKKFIKASERLIYAAPPGFADSVMRKIKTPKVNRKLAAAACFCSAAAIMLFTVTGFDQHILDFVNSNTGKLDVLFDLFKF